MSQNFHTSYTEFVTLLNAAQLEAIIGSLDAALGKHGQAFAVARGPITQNGTTVKWPAIDVFHKQESTGAWIRQQFAANGTGVAVANGFALVGDVNETDGAALTAPTPIDMDSIATVMNDRNKIILVARAPAGAGTGMLHYVALRKSQPLRGTGTLPSGGTTLGVTFAANTPAPSSGEYRVIMMASAAGFWTRDPFITARTSGGFTVNCTNVASTPTFEWLIEGD